VAEAEGAVEVSMEIIPPDRQMLHIIELWLERIPVMNEQERHVSANVVMMLNAPVHSVKHGEIRLPDTFL